MEKVSKTSNKGLMISIIIGTVIVITGCANQILLPTNSGLTPLLVVAGGSFILMGLITRRGITYDKTYLKWEKPAREYMLLSTGAGSKYLLFWLSSLLLTAGLYIMVDANVQYGITGTDWIIPAIPIFLFSVVLMVFGIRDIKNKDFCKYDKYFGYSNIVTSVAIVIRFFDIITDLGIILLIIINLSFGIYLIIKTKAIKFSE